jgi:hypothetical protein
VVVVGVLEEIKDSEVVGVKKDCWELIVVKVLALMRVVVSSCQ